MPAEPITAAQLQAAREASAAASAAYRKLQEAGAAGDEVVTAMVAARQRAREAEAAVVRWIAQGCREHRAELDAEQKSAALYRAVKYVLDRVQSNADFGYEAGHGTEAFRLLCLAEAAHLGSPIVDGGAPEVEQKRRDTYWHTEPRVLELERQLREARDEDGFYQMAGCYRAERDSARREREELRAVIGEAFQALVKAGPNIGDLAAKGLPYAIDALAKERDEIRESAQRALYDLDMLRGCGSAGGATACAHCIECLAHAAAEAFGLSAEGRAAGRAEAAEILLRQDADTFPQGGYEHGGENEGHPHSLITSEPIGDTGDYSARWDPEKVRKLFDVPPEGGRVSSLIERSEGAFWMIMAEEDSLREQLRKASPLEAEERRAAEDARESLSAARLAAGIYAGEVPLEAHVANLRTALYRLDAAARALRAGEDGTGAAAAAALEAALVASRAILTAPTRIWPLTPEMKAALRPLLCRIGTMKEAGKEPRLVFDWTLFDREVGDAEMLAVYEAFSPHLNFTERYGTEEERTARREFRASQQATRTLACGCVSCCCAEEDRCHSCGAREAPACQESRLAGGPRHVVLDPQEIA